jgi:hypothetical protein
MPGAFVSVSKALADIANNSSIRWGCTLDVDDRHAAADQLGTHDGLDDGDGPRVSAASALPLALARAVVAAGARRGVRALFCRQRDARTRAVLYPIPVVMLMSFGVNPMGEASNVMSWTPQYRSVPHPR